MSKSQRLSSMAACHHRSAVQAKSNEIKLPHLKDAIAKWHEAAQLLGVHLVEQHAIIQKNLVKAHVHLAFADRKGAQSHHASEIVKGLVSYAQWAAYTNENFDAGTAASELLPVYWERVAEEGRFESRVSLSRSMAEALRVFGFDEWGRFYEGQAILATAQLYYRRALSIADECEVTGVIVQMKSRAARRHRCQSLANASAETAQWIKVNNLLGFAGDELAKAQARRLLADDVSELARDVRFLYQRSRVTLALCAAMDEQDRLMFDSEELDMDQFFIVADLYGKAVTMAQGQLDLHPAMGAGVEDIEMTCICLNFQATLDATMGLAKRASARYAMCVRRGMTMDTEMLNDFGEMERTGRVQGLLANKWWFKSSVQFLRKSQHEKVEAEQMRNQEDMEKIRPILDRITANNTSRVGFSAFLYANLPPKSGRRLISADLMSEDRHVSKREFLKVILDYSVDKQAQYFEGPVPSEHRLLHIEISKLLNFWYEKEVKSDV